MNCTAPELAAESFPGEGMKKLTNLLERLVRAEDPRQRAKIGHPMKDITAIVFFATLANAGERAEIRLFATANEKRLKLCPTACRRTTRYSACLRWRRPGFRGSSGSGGIGSCLGASAGNSENTGAGRQDQARERERRAKGQPHGQRGGRRLVLSGRDTCRGPLLRRSHVQPRLFRIRKPIRNMPTFTA